MSEGVTRKNTPWIFREGAAWGGMGGTANSIYCRGTSQIFIAELFQPSRWVSDHIKAKPPELAYSGERDH